MDSVRKQTEDLLSKFKSGCDRCECFLINEERVMYVLKVHKVSPRDGQVELIAPGGRNRPIDPEAKWHATLKMEGDVARLEVEEMQVADGKVRVRLQPDVIVFHPRSTVRMNAESRSPVFVNFETANFALEGEMLDFSLGGARLFLVSDPELKQGEFVYKVKFYLKGRRYYLATARVAHVEQCRGNWTLGLAFDDVPDVIEDDLKGIIDELNEKKMDYFISVDG